VAIVDLLSMSRRTGRRFAGGSPSMVARSVDKPVMTLAEASLRLPLSPD